MTDFIDGVAQHAKHPDTFEIPSESEKDLIWPGDFVKVGVYGKTENFGAERFWVKVDAITKDGLHGTVSNNLICTDAHGLKYGDPVTFKRDHVLSIMSAEHGHVS